MPDVQREKAADRIVFLCGREQREHNPKRAHIVQGVLRGQIREGIMSETTFYLIGIAVVAALIFVTAARGLGEFGFLLAVLLIGGG